MEAPIVRRWEIPDEFRSLGVPAEGAVVLATGEEEVGILSAPGEGEDAFVMACEDLGGGKAMKGEDQALVTFSGARALRRSQTMMTGEESSSDDVISRVAYGDSLSDSFVVGKNVPYIIRMPGNVAHASPSALGESASHRSTSSGATTSIRKCNDLFLRPKVPDRSES